MPSSPNEYAQVEAFMQVLSEKKLNEVNVVRIIDRNFDFIGA